MLPAHKPDTTVPFAVGTNHKPLVARLRREFANSVKRLRQSEQWADAGAYGKATGTAMNAADIAHRALLDAIEALEG